MPAPTSPSSGARSKTVTVWPRRRSAIAVARPPRPAPEMMILRGTFAWIRGSFLDSIFGGETFSC